ncbi:hypothetical protein [Franconibacter helveticus]|uniref:hypothetical protein n=1 Tax=Franconibacter helveticus TaxID=357240 RepID=UPI00290D1830|nr:hypothetical protein [Franconibacter helveticus]MDU6924005.1 hypothetical protein [Franconibacter helveticus]
MEEGFYWVLYAGEKLVAYYSKEETRHYDTGALVTGVWHFAGTHGWIAMAEEATVLDGPLHPPA